VILRYFGVKRTVFAKFLTYFTAIPS